MTACPSDESLSGTIIELWKRKLETNDIGPDDDFFLQGGDSLLAVEMLLELEQNLGRKIPLGLLLEGSTVTDFVRLIEANAEARQTQTIARVRRNQPLFFFHGDWTSGGFYIKPLADLLAPEWDVFAVAPHGVDGEPIPMTIEEMAEERFADIIAAEPEGPYRIAGHCVGGIVAREVAQLMIAHDRDVEFVIMVDPPWMDGDKAREREQTSGAVIPAADPSAPATPESWQGYLEALLRYRAQPVDVPMLIFASQYEPEPWRDLSPAAEVVVKDGHHFSWVTHDRKEMSDRLRAWRNA